MKKILIFVIVAHAFGGIHAQLYDMNWVPGCLPVSTLDFVNDTVILDSLQGVPVIFTDACISDENGNLLYYTNGININNTQGTIPNGDSLSPCYYTNLYSFIGLNIDQAALFIPKPATLGYYYLFHFSNDGLDSVRPSTIYYSLINHQIDGSDTVLKKNVPILQNVRLREGGMTACKHANGRDYWLIMGASVVNKFYEFLITPDSILGPFIQTIGPQFPGPSDIAYSKFSQDGSKYATGVVQGPVLVMDFDRCSGTFNNPDTIFNEASTDPTHNPLSGSVGMEFSLNGRFLYVSDVDDINQYDLWSGNIQDSIQVFVQDSTHNEGIDVLQMAPNGKLYGSTWNGGFYFYHVINNPDGKGDSCDFVRGGQPTFSANSTTVPNLINYKLGPLVGSGCDTITSIQESIANNLELRIMPNPADKYVYAEMGKQGNYEFDFLNSLGQLVERKETRQVDIFNTEGLSNGMYFIRATNKQNGNVITTRKVVLVH